MKYYFLTFAINGQVKNGTISIDNDFDPELVSQSICHQFNSTEVCLLFYKEVAQSVGLKYSATMMIRDIVNEPR